jgi:hypothetical protein
MIKIFIPVYNEGVNIEKNLDAIYFALQISHLQNKIIIVNDGSTDNTVNKMQSLFKPPYKNFDYIHFGFPSRREHLAQAIVSRGKLGDIIVMLDGDGSVNSNAVSRAITLIQQGCDIVVGNRYHKHSVTRRSFKRLVVSKIYNWMIRVMFGSKMADHECGMKVFKYSVISALIDDLGYNLQRGFFWDAEMLIRAQRRGYSIKDESVEWTEAKKSSQSFSKDWPMILYILKFWWNREKNNQL